MDLVLAAEPTRETAEWDARAEVEIGVLIHAYLLNHPPPPASTTAPRLERIAIDLQECGRANLAALGARRLIAVDVQRGDEVPRGSGKLTRVRSGCSPATGPYDANGGV